MYCTLNEVLLYWLISQPKVQDIFMISTATESDALQIHDITARAGVFSQEEIDSVPLMFDEYLEQGPEVSGYHFFVYREGSQVLGFAIFGLRDLTDGVYDLFWIAVDPSARRKGVGRALLSACEDAVHEAGGRMLIAETSGTTEYESTREFYLRMGYVNEASIKDFYSVGDDLMIYVKRFEMTDAAKEMFGLSEKKQSTS
jgi:ribosomal protein S18 acetylase RimI-like enzyme